MSKLFRLETETGKGIYQERNHYQTIHSRETQNAIKHPEPPQDKEFRNAWDNDKNKSGRPTFVYSFGFSSAGQMKKWFSKEDFRNIKLINLEREKEGRQPYFVSVYSGLVVSGGKQAVAFLPDCKLMKRIPIEKFYPRQRLPKKLGGGKFLKKDLAKPQTIS